MSIYLTKAFWAGALERATRTAAQTLIATIPVGMGILDLDVVQALSITASAVLLSLLTSVATPDFVAGAGVEVTTDLALTEAERALIDDWRAVEAADLMDPGED